MLPKDFQFLLFMKPKQIPEFLQSSNVILASKPLNKEQLAHLVKMIFDAG